MEEITLIDYIALSFVTITIALQILICRNNKEIKKLEDDLTRIENLMAFIEIEREKKKMENKQNEKMD